MKNFTKLFWVIALAAVIVFTMAACGGDEDDNGGGPQTVTYTGTSSGTTYILKITRSTAGTTQSRDAYELTHGAKKSKGTVQKVTGGVLTLKPSNAATTFTATVLGSSITSLDGTVTNTDYTTDTLPGPLTGGNPGGGDNPFVGTWTGTFNGESVTIVCTNTNWTFTSISNNATGTYTYTGNTGQFTQTGGVNFGTGTVSGNNLTVVVVSWNQTLTFNKQNSSGGNGGTFTLTGIPAEYNGKYAGLIGNYQNDHSQGLYGADILNPATEQVMWSAISNGSVILPMWKWKENTSGQTVERYSGNDTVAVMVPIFNDKADGPDNAIGAVYFYPPDTVTFSNGSAARTWSQGELYGGNPNPGTGGTLTITNIPAELNGKYVCTSGGKEDSSVAVMGCESFDIAAGTITFSPISNGSVTIPLWKREGTTENVVRYSGNDTLIMATVLLFNVQTGTSGSMSTDAIGGLNFFTQTANNTATTFVNGSATKSWSEGTYFSNPGTGGTFSITIGNWRWESYDDSNYHGTSTCTMTQGTGADINKLTISGNVTDVYEYGHAGFAVYPNETELEKFKTATAISFKVKGDGKEFQLIIRTSDITDYSDYYTTFTANTMETTVTINMSDLSKPGWGQSQSKPFDQNKVTAIEFERNVTYGGIGSFNITISDLTLSNNNGGNDNVFTSIAEMKAWLDVQPPNTAATAYAVKLNVSDLGGAASVNGSAGYVLKANQTKHVILDLSDITFTSIGYNAFSGCASLIGVTIPDSVTSIGDGAFSDCTSLTSVTIPDSVTSIGRRAFYGTAWLNNQPNGLVYAGKVALTYKGAMPANTNINLSDGTKGIAVSAFSGCTNLTSITIPDSVTNIGGEAFSVCRGITSITIPNSVTSIGGGAFGGCNGLTSVTIPNSVTNIQGSVFLECTSLTSVTIPESVTSIGLSAFSGCTSLASVTIPGNVTSIEGAFSGCTSLTAINVDAANSAYSSQDGVLYNKDKTILVAYPSATAFNIPGSVTSIGVRAFRGSSLTNITIPDSVTSIGNYAFSDCTSLASVTIPNSITSIEFSTFDGCTSLTSVTISNSVTSIERAAFYRCTSLTSVTIPASVTSIGSSAFDLCSSLASVTFQGTITEANFSGINGDLRAKYLAGGVGTYTTTAPVSTSSVWTKQP